MPDLFERNHEPIFMLDIFLNELSKELWLLIGALEISECECFVQIYRSDFVL